MDKITEIIPDDLPEWAQKAFDEGQFFNVAISKVSELQNLAKLKDEKQLRNDIFSYFSEEHGIPLLENEIDSVVNLFKA